MTLCNRSRVTPRLHTQFIWIGKISEIFFHKIKNLNRKNYSTHVYGTAMKYTDEKNIVKLW